MPFARRCFESLLRTSVHLLAVVHFTAMAIPVLTGEFSRSSAPTTESAVPSKMTKKQIFDIAFALLVVLLFFGYLFKTGGFPFPLSVIIKWLSNTTRPIRDAVSPFRLGALFQRAANAAVDSGGARATLQTHDDMSTNTPVPTSHPQNEELNMLPSAPRCASSASDDGGIPGLASPSSA